MTKTTLVWVLGGLLMLALPTPAETDWPKVVIDDRVALSFPEEPARQENRLETLIGEVSERRFVAEAAEGTFALSSANVRPAALLFVGGREGLYQKVWSEIQKELGVTEHTVEKTEIMESRAWDISFIAQDSRPGRALLVHKQGQLYVLLAHTNRQDLADAFSAGLLNL